MIDPQLRIAIAELDAGEPMAGFEVLPTKTQWQVAFATALLAVEALIKASEEPE